MDCSDSFLIQGVIGGDQQALALLYDRHFPMVYGVALRILRDPSAAEDILQEVFMQIWRSPGSFSKVQGSFHGWMTVTARNRAIDVLRSRRPSDSVDDCILSSTHNPSNDTEHNILFARARRLLETLPKGQREALNMAFFQGMTHSEIAVLTELPLGTIKTRIRSGLTALRVGFDTPDTELFRSAQKIKLVPKSIRPRALWISLLSPSIS